VRHALERNPVPSISFLDSQPVTTTAAGRERSYDKKRLTDANGNVGLMPIASYYKYWHLSCAYWMWKASNGFWRRIINLFFGMHEIRVEEGRNEG